MNDSNNPSVSHDADAAPLLEFLLEVRVELSLPPLAIGHGGAGARCIYLVKGGTFQGPGLSGDVVPNSGADWVRVRPDGSSELDVRFCLRTNDGALLYLRWRGRFWSAAENLDYARDLAKPDDPDGGNRYYFRACPEFETDDPRYAWLNNVVGVTRSRTGDGGVIHRIFWVK